MYSIAGPSVHVRIFKRRWYKTVSFAWCAPRGANARRKRDQNVRGVGRPSSVMDTDSDTFGMVLLYATAVASTADGWWPAPGGPLCRAAGRVPWRRCSGPAHFAPVYRSGADPTRAWLLRSRLVYFFSAAPPPPDIRRTAALSLLHSLPLLLSLSLLFASRSYQTIRIVCNVRVCTIFSSV